jgi:hypothetical protein
MEELGATNGRGEKRSLIAIDPKEGATGSPDSLKLKG